MKAVIIKTRDGFNLSATLFEYPLAERVCVIHSATAVPQTFYAHYARALCEQGFNVITYDYRGIAQSRPKGKFKRLNATMKDWAVLDADGVHDWVNANFPGLAVSVMAHSFGGQILGLLTNAKTIQRVVMVASQLGYWKYFDKKNHISMLINWYVLFPFFLTVLGYIPMKWLGQGEDLPYGVAKQWRNWCVDPQYLFSELGQIEKEGYTNFSAPVLAFAFTDDAFAGGTSVHKLLEKYPKAGPPVLRELTPQSQKVELIGHFGFFRRSFKNTLWQEAFDWLKQPKQVK